MAKFSLLQGQETQEAAPLLVSQLPSLQSLLSELLEFKGDRYRREVLEGNTSWPAYDSHEDI